MEFHYGYFGHFTNIDPHELEMLKEEGTTKELCVNSSFHCGSPVRDFVSAAVVVNGILSSADQ